MKQPGIVILAIALSGCMLDFDGVGPFCPESGCPEGGAGGGSTLIGGNGGMPEQGGGGSTSDGGGGNPSVGGSNPTGGGGEGGAPPVTVMVECGPASAPIMVEIPEDSFFVCWYLETNDHPTNTILRIGGTIDSPNDPDLIADPFPGCETTAYDDPNVLCDLGPREVGTDAVLELRADGADLYVICDQFDLPGECPGEVRIYRGATLLGYFNDPPSGPWSYGGQNGSPRTLNFNDPS